MLKYNINEKSGNIVTAYSKNLQQKQEMKQNYKYIIT